MAEIDFRCDSNDKVAGLVCIDADYYIAHDAFEATETISHSYIYIGQNKITTSYHGYRCVLSFDTSGLDDNALIQSANLELWHVAEVTLGTVIIKSGMPTYPHVPAVVGDYLYTHYSGNGGSADLKYAEGTINLNYTGLSWINKTGDTKLMVLSQEDVRREPSYIYGQFYGNHASYVAYRPRLRVIYVLPTGAPSVGNANYSGIRDIFIIATANVTNDGGGYTERGFEYGMAEEPTWEVREKGVFTGTGNYSLVIPGLKPSTTYYGRAFLYTPLEEKTVYSDEWTSFTTGASPSYGIHEEANSPTICFYISEDDGHTWSLKFGPYTTDQADIAITKILVRGSGKKQIKFTTDALTGLAASVMCKLDIKAR